MKKNKMLPASPGVALLLTLGPGGLWGGAVPLVAAAPFGLVPLGAAALGGVSLGEGLPRALEMLVAEPEDPKLVDEPDVDV